MIFNHKAIRGPSEDGFRWPDQEWPKLHERNYLRAILGNGTVLECICTMETPSKGGQLQIGEHYFDINDYRLFLVDVKADPPRIKAISDKQLEAEIARCNHASHMMETVLLQNETVRAFLSEGLKDSESKEVTLWRIRPGDIEE